MEVSIPNYSQYTLIELTQSLATIDAEKYPDNFSALTKAFETVEPRSQFELEDCIRSLSKTRNKQYVSYFDRYANKYDEEPTRFFKTQADDIYVDQEPEHMLKKRLAAFSLDMLLIFLLKTALMLPHTMANAKKNMFMKMAGMPIPADPLGDMIGTGIVLVAMLVYFTFFHYRNGQTPGKVMLGIMVLDKSGERFLSFKHSLMRTLVPLLGLFILFGAQAYSFATAPKKPTNPMAMQAKMMADRAAQKKPAKEEKKNNSKDIGKKDIKSDVKKDESDTDKKVDKENESTKEKKEAAETEPAKEKSTDVKSKEALEEKMKAMAQGKNKSEWGKKPSVPKKTGLALLLSLLGVFAFLWPLLDGLTARFNQRRKALHDRIAKSHVVGLANADSFDPWFIFKFLLRIVRRIV